MDKRIVDFSNEYTRTSADRFVQAIFQMQAHLAKYNCIKDVIPQDNTVVDDGSPDDGRNNLTCADIHFMAGLVKSIGDSFSGDSDTGETVYARIMRIAVHIG